MNLFYLDEDFDTNASYHIDRHMKIIVEAAQMLSTACRVNNLWAPYKITHLNHGTNRWIRESKDNYDWTIKYALALCKEFTYRSNKIHKTQKYIEYLDENRPQLPSGKTPFYLAMPNLYKQEDAILSYREYYRNEKIYDKNGKRMDFWTKRERPLWMTEGVPSDSRKKGYIWMN